MIFRSSLRQFSAWVLSGFKRRSTLFGKAEWMSDGALRKFASPRNRGLVLSPKHRLSETDSFRNLALIAPTGSGKTSCFCFQNICYATGSVVCSDPKAELYKNTSGYIRSRGYQVQLLQPAMPELSCGFNPCLYARNVKDLRMIAKTLVANSKSDGVWAVQAVTLMSLGLQALRNANDPTRFHLGNLRTLLNLISQINAPKDDETSPDIDRFMAETLPDDAFAEYQAFLRQNDRFIGDVLSTVMAALEPWSDPDIVAFTAHDTVRLNQLRTQKTILYLVIPPHLVEYYSPVMALFYNTCFSHCIATADDGGEAVYFFMDEFGNMGPIPYFDAIATTLRSSRCSLNIILQEISQLVAIYGPHKAKSIYSGGMGNKLFFGGIDAETAQYLERILGQNTAYDTLTGDIDPQARIAGKPLLAAHEARMMDQGQAVLVSTNKAPIKMAMPHYSAYPQMDRWMAMPYVAFDRSLGLHPSQVSGLNLPPKPGAAVSAPG